MIANTRFKTKKTLILVVLSLLVLFFPRMVLAEGKVVPVRCVKIVNTDNLGNELRFPTGVFYDEGEDELYVTNPQRSQLVVLASDYFPILSVGAGRGLKNVTGCYLRGGTLFASVGADGDVQAHVARLNAAFIPEKKIFLTGFEGAEEFQPYRLAVGQTGNLYVTGLNATGVLVFDSEGRYIKTISPRDEILGVAENASIVSVAVGADGRLYLLSEEMGRVYVYDKNEKYLYKFAEKGGQLGMLARPRGIAVDDRRRRVYIADYQRHSIAVFSIDGTFLFEFGGLGAARGWFAYPSDVAVDGLGRVLVADTFNHRVQVFELLDKQEHLGSDNEVLVAGLDGRVPESTGEMPPPERGESLAGEDGELPKKLRPEDLGVLAVSLPSGTVGQFVLLVSISSDKAGAESLRASLKEKGYDVFIQQVDVAGMGIWYQVINGPYAELDSAVKTVDRLKSEEQFNPIIKRVSQNADHDASKTGSEPEPAQQN